jgi:uncharacterized repeat protein (TIGR03803 family)
LTTLHNFSGPDGGDAGEMLQATDGNLYGVTGEGGGGACQWGCGTIFKMTSGGALTTLYTFSGPDGAGPTALIQATDGNFYGTTLYGAANYGTVFALSVGLGPFVRTLPIGGKVGTSVAVLGTNLAGATRVTFNGIAAAFSVKSSGTAITTAVPSGATTGMVQVITPAANLSSNVAFRVRH